MADYQPYEPAMRPVPVAPDLWTVEGPVVQYRGAGIALPCPTRMTVVRLPSGGLWLHSPVAPDPSLRAFLAELGPIEALVAPNSFHYLGLQAWADLERSAAVWVSPRMPAKAPLPERAQVLGPEPPTHWQSHVDHVFFDAKAWCETLFLHRPTGTLIVTDLIQQFEPKRFSTWWAAWMMRIGGACDQPPCASIEMKLQARLAGGRTTLREAWELVQAWPVERVLIAHGKQPTGDPQAILRGAFQWLK